MLNRKTTAFLLLAVVWGAPAWAQSNYSGQQGSPSISDRIKSFRDSLFGPPQSNNGYGQNPNMRSNQGGNGYNGQGYNNNQQRGQSQRFGNGQMQNGQQYNGRNNNGQNYNGQRYNNQNNNGQQRNGQQYSSGQTGRVGNGNGRMQAQRQVPSSNQTREFNQQGPSAPRTARADTSRRPGNQNASQPPSPPAQARTEQPAQPKRTRSSRRTSQPNYVQQEDSSEDVEASAVVELDEESSGRLTPADLGEASSDSYRGDEVITDPDQMDYQPPPKRSSRRKANQTADAQPEKSKEEAANEQPADIPVVLEPAPTLPRVTSSAQPSQVEENSTPRVELSRGTTNAQKGNEFVVTRRGPSIRVETAGPKRIMVNKPGTYSVNLLNSGEVAAQDVLVVVQVPAWAEVLSAEATTGESREPPQGRTAGEFHWAVDSLDARSNEELVLQIVAHENRSFDLAVQLSSSPVTAQTKVEVQEAKLQASLSGPREVSFGEKAVYKLTFSNPGSADAENVVVHLMPLGNGTEPIETHSLGKLSAGSSKTVEVELVARQEGQVKVQVQATADGGLSANASEDVVVRRPVLQVAVDAPKFRYSGTVATYDITVANKGNDVARDVEVSVQLPRGAEFASCSSGGQRAGSGVTWQANSVKPGEEKVFQVRCSLTTPGPNRVQAAATAAGNINHASVVMTEVEALADLTLDVHDPQGAIAVGEELEYEIVIRNRGTKAAEEVEVVAAFSASVEPLSATGGQFGVHGSTVEFETIESIAAGEELTLKIKAKALRAGTHVLRTEVRSKTMPTALVEEETTRFYGDNDDVDYDEAGYDETSSLKKSTDEEAGKTAKFQPRKRITPRGGKPSRGAAPAAHQSDEWVATQRATSTDTAEESSASSEPRHLDEPAELMPIDR
ncbi:MAG: CARDB domain-containing protein [Pirellulales bacterium]